MDLKELAGIRAICETGSFRKAALSLGVSQPTLSARIARLEDVLGAALFEREGGRSRPTTLALQVVSRTAALMDEAGRIDNEIRRLAEGDSGLVRVGLAPGPAHSLAVTLLAEITTALPDVSLEVAISTPQRLIEWMTGDELDVAVSPTPGPVDPLRLNIEPLFDDEIVFVARSDHPLFQLHAPTIDQVFRYPVVLSGIGSRYKAILADMFSVDIDRTPGRITGLNFDLCLSIVMRGRHFTVGPRFVFRDELERQTLRALDVEVPFRHAISLLSRRDALPLPAVDKIKQLVRSTLGQSAKSEPHESEG